MDGASPAGEKRCRLHRIAWELDMRLSEIRIYPVKGLRGLSVEAAVVEPWGLARDRRWMVVDANGRFLSQREAPEMARIAAESHGGGLRLTMAGREALVVATPSGCAVEVVVWRDAVPARAAGAGADAWLSAALGRPCRLVFMADPAEARPVDQTYGEPADRVSFADGYPLLATNPASLADLSARAGMPDLSMDRFRTNLVIDGAEAWGEDHWRELRIGDAVFAVVKPCARCAVTTVDQDRGERHPEGEPLRTLLTFRRDARGQPIFGQNLIPRRLGEIHVGDAVVAVPA
jgi:hypothetical protein